MVTQFTETRDLNPHSSKFIINTPMKHRTGEMSISIVIVRGIRTEVEFWHTAYHDQNMLTRVLGPIDIHGPVQSYPSVD